MWQSLFSKWLHWRSKFVGSKVEADNAHAQKEIEQKFKSEVGSKKKLQRFAMTLQKIELSNRETGDAHALYYMRFHANYGGWRLSFRVSVTAQPGQPVSFNVAGTRVGIQVIPANSKDLWCIRIDKELQELPLQMVQVLKWPANVQDFSKWWLSAVQVTPLDRNVLCYNVSVRFARCHRRAAPKIQISGRLRMRNFE